MESKHVALPAKSPLSLAVGTPGCQTVTHSEVVTTGGENAFHTPRSEAKHWTKASMTVTTI